MILWCNLTKFEFLGIFVAASSEDLEMQAQTILVRNLSHLLFHPLKFSRAEFLSHFCLQRFHQSCTLEQTLWRPFLPGQPNKVDKLACIGPLAIHRKPNTKCRSLWNLWRPLAGVDAWAVPLIKRASFSWETRNSGSNQSCVYQGTSFLDRYCPFCHSDNQGKGSARTLLVVCWEDPPLRCVW